MAPCLAAVLLGSRAVLLPHRAGKHCLIKNISAFVATRWLDNIQMVMKMTVVSVEMGS